MSRFYVDRVNVRAGEFVLIDKNKKNKRCYFDFIIHFYGHNNGGIGNSLRKRFPISRKEVVELTKDFLHTENYIYERDATKNAKKAYFHNGIDSVYDYYGNEILHRDNWDNISVSIVIYLI